MKQLASKISIQVNENTFLKNPESSTLGRSILTGSIDMLDDLGFEAFTFKKLAHHIGSTEASVYRYFESKHKLLLYLMSWYWNWMDYKLTFSIVNIPDPKIRLDNAIDLLVRDVKEDNDFTHLNEVKLNHIVIAESSKVYMNKQVDEDNKLGVFKGYKSLVGRVSEIILEINPDYKYAHMLVSTAIETAHHQRFFAAHLPLLTDVVQGEDAVVSFCHSMVFKTIGIHE